MITTCKKCGSKNLCLEPRIKGQDVLTANMVALKCKDCDTWLKWCPKDERQFYLIDKWQKLKEYLKNQITDLRHIDIKTKTQSLRINDGGNWCRQVLCKMRELEEEDE